MKKHIKPSSPCRCFSGKPYKDCCAQLTHLPKDASTDLKRRFWGRYIDEVIGTLLSSLAAKGMLEATRAEATHQLFEDEDVPLDDMAVVAIDAFALFHMDTAVPLFDEEEEDLPDHRSEPSEEDAPSAPLALIMAEPENFFERSPHDTVFLELLRSPFSWLRVVDVSPDYSITLHDILLDRQFTVVDRSASRTVQQGVILCGKVLRFDGISLLAGVCPRMLPPHVRQKISAMAKSLRRSARDEFKEELNDSILRTLSHVLLSMFMKLSAAVYSAPPPILHNTDGDLIEPRLLEYEFRDTTVQEMAHFISQTLDSIADGPEPEIEKRDRKGHPTRIMVPYVRESRGNPNMETVLVARILVERKMVSVEVNSPKRAEHLREVLTQLGDKLKFVRERVPDPYAPTSQKKSPKITPQNMPPEIRAALTEKLRALQEAWLTNPVPALQGMTPIEASRSAEMQPVLEALLDDFAIKESAANGSGMMTFDVQELRTRLGLNNKLN